MRFLPKFGLIRPHYTTLAYSSPLYYSCLFVPTILLLLIRPHYTTLAYSSPLYYSCLFVPTILLLLIRPHYTTLAYSSPLYYSCLFVPTILLLLIDCLLGTTQHTGLCCNILHSILLYRTVHYLKLWLNRQVRFTRSIMTIHVSSFYR